jgi:hypothetical protein
MTDTIVFLGQPAVRLCKKVRSKWSGNWYKITSNLLFFSQSRAAVHRPNGEHLLGTFCTNIVNSTQKMTDTVVILVQPAVR